MKNVQITDLTDRNQNVEFVERKGLGHPDIISDILINYLACELYRAYQENFQEDIFFDLSSSFLLPGETRSGFEGTGMTIKPITLVIGGCAVEKYKRKVFNLDYFLKDKLYSYLLGSSPFRFLHNNNLVIRNELKYIPFVKNKQKVFYASENWVAIGYANKTLLEKIVYAVERLITSDQIRMSHREVGEDVRIFGLREKNRYQLNISIAFTDFYIKNYNDYKKKKIAIVNILQKYIYDNFQVKPTIVINSPKDSEIKKFLTVTGLFIENYGFGKVGTSNTSNNQNGVINYGLPNGTGSGVGKHPLHVSRVFNVLAQKISDKIFQITYKKNCVWLYNFASKPVNDQKVVQIKIENREAKDTDLIIKIVNSAFNNLYKIIQDIHVGKHVLSY